jgi:hypothetical protein
MLVVGSRIEIVAITRRGAGRGRRRAEEGGGGQGGGRGKAGAATGFLAAVAMEKEQACVALSRTRRLPPTMDGLSAGQREGGGGGGRRHRATHSGEPK